jgi:hypothetical protein
LREKIGNVELVKETKKKKKNKKKEKGKINSLNLRVYRNTRLLWICNLNRALQQIAELEKY